jgi:hypothetical protein
MCLCVSPCIFHLAGTQRSKRDDINHISALSSGACSTLCAPMVGNLSAVLPDGYFPIAVQEAAM